MVGDPGGAPTQLPNSRKRGRWWEILGEGGKNLRDAGCFPNQVRKGWLATLWIMQNDPGEQEGYDPE